jgi:hypothetical protein
MSNNKKFNSKAQERRQAQTRNWLAVHAHHRKGGPMKDRKKEDNKKACRGRVTLRP